MSTRGKLFSSLALTAFALWAQGHARDAKHDAASPSDLPKREPLVTLNVVAFDSKGQPVGDLSADDFQIQDQGKRQQIVFFRRNDAKPHALGTPGPQQYSNRNGATVQQATVILMDLLNADMADRGSGWEGISRALEHLESSDNLYLYLLTADAKLYPVHGLPGTESTDSPGGRQWTQQIRTVLDQAVRTVNRLKPQDERDPVIRVRQTYQALGTLASQMAAIPGRKSMVWITHGVPVNFRTLTNDWVDMTGQLRQFCMSLNQSGVAMYTVDQGGPGSFAPGSGDREGPGYQSQDTLQQMADLTGGHAYPGNNAEAAIPAAMASARGSYLILYDPPAQNWDGKFHKIRVNCTRKGIRIQAQQGYLATPKEAVDRQIRASFDAAATNPLDASGIGLTSATPISNAAHSYHFELRIDPSDLVLFHQGDHENAHLAIGFFGIKGSQLQPSPPVLMNVNLTKEQFEAAAKQGVPFVHDQVLGEGLRGIRIVVLDLNSAETGALTIPLAAPAATTPHE